MESKVLLCLVRSYTDSDWLNSKMLQLTFACQEWWSDNRYDLKIINNYEDINKHIKKYDWIVVQTAGDIITDRDYLDYKFKSIDPSIGLITHLLWYKDEDNCPYMHHQCFIINCKAINKNIDFKEGEDTGPCLLRSKEDMHDGHAPLSVKYGKRIITRRKKFGTNLILQVLDNGFTVQNFDHSWRFNPDNDIPSDKKLEEKINDFGFPTLPVRGYIWPELNSKHYERALKTLRVNKYLDPLQAAVIYLFKHSTNLKCLNVLHWDKFSKLKKCDCVIAPATGFLAESMAMQTGAKKIIFFDINDYNLDFKKNLYNTWNGKDYFNYSKSWANSRDLLIEPSTDNGMSEAIKTLSEVDKILNSWDYFKKLEIEFLKIDIIKDIDVILDKIKNETAIHTSSIFTYYLFSHIIHDKKIIDSSKKRLSLKIKETKSKWIETR